MELSYFGFGVAFALLVRFLLDRYVERYKQSHRQWPYDRERF